MTLEIDCRTLLFSESCISQRSAQEKVSLAGDRQVSAPAQHASPQMQQSVVLAPSGLHHISCAGQWQLGDTEMDQLTPKRHTPGLSSEGSLPNQVGLLIV